MILRAILAFAFVWLLMPHEPDLGLGLQQPISQIAVAAQPIPCETSRNTTCDGLVFETMLASIGSFEALRTQLLHGIDRVRSDLRANRIQLRG